MIINTGQRTDIPAFYSDWFVNRLKAGFVLVRNPYNPRSVTRYRLSPEVVDLIGFCTKNPAPMLPHLDLLRPYGQYWYVTITPYGKEIEPGVPDKREVLDRFRRLSDIVGPDRMGWRYDPVFISGDYPAERHIRAFEYMAQTLSGYTRTAVISFVDLYEKTKRNFPEVRPVTAEQRLQLGKAFVEIAGQYGMTLRPCGEGDELAPFGADCSGCMTVAMYEQALGRRLKVPKTAPARTWAGTSARTTPAVTCAGTATPTMTRPRCGKTWRRMIRNPRCSSGTWSRGIRCTRQNRKAGSIRRLPWNYKKRTGIPRSPFHMAVFSSAQPDPSRSPGRR